MLTRVLPLFPQVVCRAAVGPNMGCPCRVSLCSLANPCASVVELLMFTNSDLQLLLAPTGQVVHRGCAEDSCHKSDGHN